MTIQNTNNSYFTEAELSTLLSQWDSQYTYKTHEKKIKSVELSKIYDFSDKEKIKKFAVRISMLYSFLTFEHMGNYITVKASVKPATVEEFISFSKQLTSLEKEHLS